MSKDLFKITPGVKVWGANWSISTLHPCEIIILLYMDSQEGPRYSFCQKVPDAAIIDQTLTTECSILTYGSKINYSKQNSKHLNPFTTFL